MYPLQIRFQRGGEGAMPQVLFVVPKKNFKKAVVRNRIRRRLKEAYRLQKETFSSILEKLDVLAIVYVGKEPKEFGYIRNKLAQILQMIENHQAN